jgi:hypothetical protein
VLIIALVLAVIGLAALVFAVVTSNEFIAYICIAASVLGVILLIVDALRERQRRAGDGDHAASVAGESNRDTETAADDGRDGGDSEDYPEEEGAAADKTATLRKESGAGASSEPGGSDEYDHDTADQTAAGNNTTDKADNTDTAG